MSGRPRRQKGITLVIALIFLAIITLLATSTLGSTSATLQVVGNMQSRDEALDAGQRAIEAAISTTRFMTNPADAVPNPCGAANTYCSDLNGDGRPDYITRLDPAPSCVSAKIVKVSELNLSSAEDRGCWGGQVERSGDASGESLCADTHWEITTETRSTFSPTKVTVTQGLAIRISSAAAEAHCTGLRSGIRGGNGLQASPGVDSVRAGQGQPMKMTDAVQRSAPGYMPRAGQKTRPVITQRRRRTYWYIHQDG